MSTAERSEIFEDFDRRRYTAVVRALSSEYQSVYYADIERNILIPFSNSGRIVGKCGEGAFTDMSYTAAVEAYVNNACAPEDRERLRRALSKEYMQETLKDHPYYYLTYLNDRGKYCRMKCAPGDDSGSLENVVVGFAENDEEIRREMENRRKLERDNAVISCLADDFACVIYVNTDSGREAHYRMNSVFSDKIPDWESIEDINVRIRRMADCIVYPSERELFLRESQPQKVLENVRKNKIYYVNFKTNEEPPHYYQLKFVRDESSNSHLTVGLLNMDEQIKAELEREAQLAAAKEKAEQTVARRTAELRARNEELFRNNDEIITLMGGMVDLRDNESGDHILRVKKYTNMLTRRIMQDWPEYGLTEMDVDIFTSASALHDVGKILISDTILLKPGKLTKDEFEIMKSHSDMGCRVLNRAPRSWSARYLSVGLDICRYHHEKWDGSGYPLGLKGDEIPISAQIVSVADCYDALTSKRVYKDAYGPDVAFNMIVNGECGQFSDKIITSFTACRDDFAACATSTENAVFDSSVNVLGLGKLKDLRLLLVDDNDLIREINKDILTDEGAIVIEADCGETAVDMYRRDSNFDAILMDIVMPGMNGIEATAMIREIEETTGNRVPIISLTAEGSNPQIMHTITAGADAFMLKPLTISELVRILMNCAVKDSTSE